MFDIGWSEILIIAVVTIIVVGPKDLPRLLRSVGQIMRKVRSTANEFRSQFEDVIREAELDDLKSTMDDVKSMNPINQMKNAINDEVDGVRDIVSETDIRNYHEDFPDDEPYEDFDDPGAEWSDEDDALFEDPKPKPANDSAQLKSAKTGSVKDQEGPDVEGSNADIPPKKISDVTKDKPGKPGKTVKGAKAGKTAKSTKVTSTGSAKKSGAKKAPSRAARGRA